MTTMTKKIAYAAPLALFLLPYVVFACTPNNNVWNPSILKGPLVTCSGAPLTITSDASGKLTVTPNDKEACHSICDLVCTAANVVYFGIGVVIWIIAPIFILWSGLLLMLSRGNPEGLSKAKKMVTQVVIGLLIVLVAYLLVYTFVKVVGISGIGGFGTDVCQIQS